MMRFTLLFILLISFGAQASERKAFETDQLIETLFILDKRISFNEVTNGCSKGLNDIVDVLLINKLDVKMPSAQPQKQGFISSIGQAVGLTKKPEVKKETITVNISKDRQFAMNEVEKHTCVIDVNCAGIDEDTDAESVLYYGIGLSGKYDFASLIAANNIKNSDDSSFIQMGIEDPIIFKFVSENF